MSASSPIAFCPRCNQQVLLVRKQFETCLAIVLLLFTVIGFFIYLAVYYSRKPEFCIHCRTQITFSQAQIQFQPPRNISEDISLTTSSYCPLCGEKLSQSGIKFCPNCGGKVT